MPRVRRPPLSICLALFLPGTLAAQTAAGRYQQVFAQLSDLAPRPDRVALVHDLTLRRDSMEFRLRQGDLSLATPVEGRTVGAVFVGEGSVRFDPPPGVERAEMRRVLSDSARSWPITAAAFVFTDSTAAELARRLHFTRNSAARAQAAKPLHDALSRLLDGRHKEAESTALLSALLNGDANGFFYAQVERRHGEDLMLMLDPEQAEQVVLLRRGRLPEQRLQVVSRFAAGTARDSEVIDDGRHEPLRLADYRIETTIAKGLDLTARVWAQLTARRHGIRWFPLRLYSELKVDSVGDAGGGADDFVRTPHGDGLWVRLGRPLAAGETRKVWIAYHGSVIGHGSLMEQFLRETGLPRAQLPAGFDQWFYVKSSQTWFPRYGSSQPADVDLTFHVPHRYRLASIGRLVDSLDDGDVRTTHWVSERPTDQVCFNLGEFEETRITDQRIPPVTVQTNAAGHRKLEQILLARPDPQSVAADVANSLAFFTTEFGAPLYTHYYVTEIPGAYGQAFPGLMYLSVSTYETLDESGFEEQFRAHEMAHQWWGIGVEPASERDAWLSEGFASFAGLWYMQMILHSNDKFFRQLREWREAIHARRHDAPPVALGYRIGQTDRPEDYDLIVYRKGAWVLQMLRNLMLNLHTMDEGIFTATMQDFYLQYRGRRASTGDFQRVVERHMGMSMQWFFDEWVYGTDIPTYILSWRTEPAAGGRALLHLRVRQEDVPKGFIMPVPLRIEFANGAETFVRVNVRGPLTEGTIPLPAEPQRLELNPLGSVLAEVKTEDWR